MPTENSARGHRVSLSSPRLLVKASRSHGQPGLVRSDHAPVFTTWNLSRYLLQSHVAHVAARCRLVYEGRSCHWAELSCALRGRQTPSRGALPTLEVGGSPRRAPDTGPCMKTRV
ncbi:hypothetical protein CgunFtcFv8_024140 [Champsocephalus gunnari]|uniref:Uncharacterized protein n=1 Tax=Champsocephalus gunnari TaxID=52237 RepID=A0AAN8HM62_CHAGU|nr:hypothetical protein CgunFtcFv8_024140 [Champsocephalus gunnari]